MEWNGHVVGSIAGLFRCVVSPAVGTWIWDDVRSNRAWVKDIDVMWIWRAHWRYREWKWLWNVSYFWSLPSSIEQVPETPNWFKRKSTALQSFGIIWDHLDKVFPCKNKSPKNQYNIISYQSYHNINIHQIITIILNQHLVNLLRSAYFRMWRWRISHCVPRSQSIRAVKQRQRQLQDEEQRQLLREQQQSLGFQWGYQHSWMVYGKSPWKLGGWLGAHFWGNLQDSLRMFDVVWYSMIYILCTKCIAYTYCTTELIQIEIYRSYRSISICIWMYTHMQTFMHIYTSMIHWSLETGMSKHGIPPKPPTTISFCGTTRNAGANFWRHQCHVAALWQASL